MIEEPFSSKIYSQFKAKSKLEEDVKNLHKLWEQLEKLALPNQTPPNYVDHGRNHILCVMHYLDQLIPKKVLSKLTAEECYLLLAGCMCHDIGMMKIKNKNPDEIFKLRKTHGKIGVEILKKSREIFSIPDKYFLGVCEIVKNHQGKFNPKSTINIPNVKSIPELALLVRLADELHFGQDRAPSFVAELIDVPEFSLKFWLEHNNIDPPQIFSEVLRIYIRGNCVDDKFIKKLNSEFNSPVPKTLQREFFGRGGYKFNYILIDEIERECKSDRNYIIDPKNPLEKKLDLAKSLYIESKYDAAKEFWEEMLDSNDIKSEIFSDYSSYLRFYVKTYEKIGDFADIVEISDEFVDKVTDEESLADIRKARSLIFYKLHEFEAGIREAEHSLDYYEKIVKYDYSHFDKIALADIYTIISMLLLGNYSKRKKSSYLDKSEEYLGKAWKLYENLYEDESVSNKTHYLGRFYGQSAFMELARIELDIDKVETCNLLDDKIWEKAFSYATLAKGQLESLDRNIIGNIAGTYGTVAILLKMCELYSDYDNCDTFVYSVKVLSLYEKLNNLIDLSNSIKLMEQSNWFKSKVTAITIQYNHLLIKLIDDDKLLEHVTNEEYSINIDFSEKDYNLHKDYIYLPLQ